MFRKTASLAFFLAAAGCSSWFQKNPAVVPETEQCVACVGTQVVADYTSANPIPIYPPLRTQMLAECGSECGADIATIISAVASSSDPQVQATPAFAEAVARRSSMLAK